MPEHYMLLTDIGAARLANAQVTGGTVQLSEIALGDGGGIDRVPTKDRTSLYNEVWRAQLNDVRIHGTNSAWIVCEGVVPPEDGPFWVREVGIFDSAGYLIAYGNYPTTYKPDLAGGAGLGMLIQPTLEVSATETVTITVDPSAVLATRAHVADRLAAHEASRNHPAATTDARGFVELATPAETLDGVDEERATTPSSVSAAIFQHGPLAGFRNKLINPNALVAQDHGDGAVNLGSTLDYYGPDMWLMRATGGVAATIRRGISGSYEGWGCLRFQSITGGAGGAISVEQLLPDIHSEPLREKDMHLSVRLYSTFSTQVTLAAHHATTGPNDFSAQTPIASATLDYTAGDPVTLLELALPNMPTGCTNGLMIYLSAEVPDGTVGGELQLGDWQLEEGLRRTPQEERPWQVEKALCMAFYEKSSDDGQPPGTMQYNGGVEFRAPQDGTSVVPIRFAVPKWKMPSVQAWNPVSGTTDQNNAVRISSGTNIAFSASSAGCGGFAGGYQTFAGAAGNTVYFHWLADARLFR